MYTKHFGLKMLPFENVPDPKFFFDQGDYARVLNRITDSLKAGRGLMVVTGPIGSGKTTLSQKIMSDFSNDIKVIWIAEPPGNSTDFFLFIAQELGIKPSSSERVFIIRDIRDALLKIRSEGRKYLMIIDESHLMTDEILNDIRLLNNLEEGSTKLLQILLLGQVELMGKINKPEMEPFKQRIATLEIIGKMNISRVRNYILYRIQVAGGNPSIISDTGMEGVIITSGGIPRIINSLCDRSFNLAFESGKSAVDVHDVHEVAKDMGLGKETFQYIFNLKKKEQVQSSIENVSMQKTEKLSGGLPGSPNSKSDRINIEKENRQPNASQSVCKESESGLHVPKADQKGLRTPVLFLSLSIIALFFSLFFFCQRAGSPDSITCLQKLIGL